MENVVITGLGLISPLGIGVKSNWDAAMRSASGVSQITQFDPTGYPVTIAGEVKQFNPLDYLDPRDVKKLDRFAQFAVAASDLAVKDANLDFEKFTIEQKDRFGVVIGTGIGGMINMERTVISLVEKGPRRGVSPFFIPSILTNIAGGNVAIRYGITGVHVCPSTACATGATAIGDAARLIERGDADIIISGGTEATLTGVAVAGFASLKALSRRNSDPERASRPFDKDRDGFVMGEGAGIVILENKRHALERGAKIYGKVTGYGSTCDAHHITAPHPEGRGARNCMEAAIRDAKISKEKIGYINAHATSTGADVVESMAIKQVFGEHAYNLVVSSTKSMTGHLLGAAGGAELIFSILALNEGMIPPTINLDNPDDGCDLNYSANFPTKKAIDAALSNSFGFGGVNASLVIEKL